MQHFTYIQENLYLAVFVSVTLQIIGTAILGLFSFYGLRVEQSKAVFAKGKPVSHVTVSTPWLNAARAALIVLLTGITLGGVAAVASLN